MKLIVSILLSIISFSAWGQGVIKIEKHRMKIESNHQGIRRVVNYDVTARDVPEEFEGVKIAFLADIHYKSRLDERGLNSIRNILMEVKPDVILLGGDYQEGCEYVESMVKACTAWKAPLGMAGVMGNNDYERCTNLIRDSFEANGVRILEGDTMSIRRGKSEIIVAGAKNVFKHRETEPSPTLSLADSSFVLLLTHTPDYIEDVDISHTDLALAGHLHGGQVTLFGLWAPVKPSHYGRRFLKGIKKNSAGIPAIVSTGIGTSRADLRLFAPSEIIIITLHKGV
ncbi:MAG: metallophosphoesterase [Bacteroidales bacterium]|nr:metallophosphoesterase [Bacteroidales bacterium]